MSESAMDKPVLSFTGRMAGWSARHRWIVVLGAVAVLVISFLLSGSVGVETSDVSGTGDSAKGEQLIEDRFEQLPSFDSVIIKNPGLDVDDEAFRSTVEHLAHPQPVKLIEKSSRQRPANPSPPHSLNHRHHKMSLPSGSQPRDPYRLNSSLASHLSAARPRNHQNCGIPPPPPW